MCHLSSLFLFSHRRVPNPWNPAGNGWKLDTAGEISVKCFHPVSSPLYDCNVDAVGMDRAIMAEADVCKRISLSSKGRLGKYQPDKLGKCMQRVHQKKGHRLTPIKR